MNTAKYLLILIIPLFVACSPENDDALNDLSSIENNRYDLALNDKLSDFKPLPAKAVNLENPSNTSKIDLGHALYFDTRLSKDGNISCNSCHDLARFGVDKLSFSPGDAGENGDRNSPTVLNAALHTSQFWDGRAKDVEEQAGMPILNPVEMAIPNEAFLMDRLSKVDFYVALFAKAFPGENKPMTYQNLSKAIASFERELLTPSRFDEYLKGDKAALTLEEKKGLLNFTLYKCTTCHKGELLGGNSLQKFGVYEDYWKLTGSEVIDNGREKVTGDKYDKYFFKVPSLRNITETGPYFHDGSVSDLNEAIRIMAEMQLNDKISDSQVESIVSFLGALRGEVPQQFQTAPAILMN